MTAPEIRDLFDRVHRGDLQPADAQSLLEDRLRTLPFEDLGFARVDHHRSLRQGFPEVILGLGKTPAEIAAIAERIVARGQTLLVTRASASAFEAVQAVAPAAVYHERARAITLLQNDIEAGTGVVLVAAAGTSDQPVAEEAAVTAEVMGNRVDRLYDVGVAGLHRLLREHERLRMARVIVVVAGMEGALPSVVAGLVSTSHRGTYQHRLRRQLWRSRRSARDAEQLRERRLGREHRQRFRCGVHRQPDQPLAAE